jgi:hypothetical protein
MRRIVCFPGCAARQPGPRSGISADSIGCSALSEVISTLAKRSRSNQASPERETASEPELIVCLRIRHPISLGIIILDTVNTDAQVCASAEEDKNLEECVLGVLKKLLRCKPYGTPRAIRISRRHETLQLFYELSCLRMYSISRRLFKHEITMDERKGSAAGHPEREPFTF